MAKTIGAIYPLPADLVDRLFDGKPKVFVKFLPHRSTKLVRGSKIIFYASRGNKKLVGEGRIEKVEFLTPENVISEYKERLFLNESEFYAYVRRSPTRNDTKEILTLVLNGLKRYPRPIAYNKPLAMAGQYLSVAEYQSLIKGALE